jgi:hypothetical protein
MTDQILTAMVSPNNQVTYCTRDGTPYRGDANNLVYAPAKHVAELTSAGFATASVAQVPAGAPLQDDTGWAVAQ